MSRPLSILHHQGHLEPTTARPGFTSKVINTVLTLHCAPSASLHRLPTPHHWHCRLQTRQLTGCSLGAGAPAPSHLGGDRQQWLRPETGPCERRPP